MQKAQRWYGTIEVDGVRYYEVYNQPYKSKASSVSTVKDLNYYRREFTLRKVWGDTPPEMI